MFIAKNIRILAHISKQNRPLLTPIDSNLEDVINQRRNIRRSLAKKYQENLPIEQNIKKYYDNLVSINLYMRHDHWSSQYIYLLMNYEKLGFRRVSDLGFLDRASYLLNLRKLKDEDRWPSIKVNVALQPTIVLTGVAEISEFFRYNKYFQQQIEKDSNEVTSLQKYINEQVLPNMESMFWHPLLTFQYSFHTNLSSYEDTSGGYTIISILMRNLGLVAGRSAINLIKIAKYNEMYARSKQKLTSSLRELESMYLKQRPFFGGDKPNHVDFYLMSNLRTKINSKLFMNYLQGEVGKQFWSWWMRLGSLCHYNKDRTTMI